MRTLASFALLLAVQIVVAQPAAAQGPAEPPAPAPAQTPPPQAPPEPSLAEMIGSAGAAEAELLKLQAELAPDAKFEDLQASLPAELEMLEQRAEAARQRMERANQLRQLTDIENRWLTDQKALEVHREELTGRALAILASLERVDGLIATWQKSQAEARQLKAPAKVIERIGTTLEAARSARAKLTRYRKEVLALQAQVGGGLARVADILELTKRAQQAMRGGLLGTDSLPVWAAVRERGDIAVLLADAVEAIRDDLDDTREFLLAHGPRLARHALLFLLLLALLLSLRPRVRRWAAEDEDLAPSVRLLLRPVAAALLLAAIVEPLLYPTAPSYFEGAFMLVALVATLRLLPTLLEPGARRALYALAGFFVVDRLRDGLVGLPLVSRLIFEAELTLAIAALVFLLPPRRLSLLPRAEPLQPLYLLVRRLALATLAVALFCSVIGFVELSRLLGNGILASAYVGVVTYATFEVLAGLISLSLRAELLQGLNLIRDHRALVTRRVLGFGRAGALLIWVGVSLDLLSLREPVVAAVAGALAASLTVGELEVSLGDLIALGVTLLVSVYLARFIRYVLDEDVLPRMSLPRGVPFAISSTTFYVVLAAGIFASLAAAGLDLSRFTLLAGALGVGIGFGLQNVVNNFVSGLVLLFERPVQTGDTIEIGDTLGEVRRIGIRSSTVRTWQGAEVIVPNANLISEQVVNWTLSDRNRRIDIDVGVRYGTDPERVIELLLGVAHADDRVRAHPEPSALFTAFGDSALQFRLRAWTGGYADWIQIKSDLAVAVNRALCDAGIEIPVPQRDLHLRSIDEDASRKLRGEGPRPPRPEDEPGGARA